MPATSSSPTALLDAATAAEVPARPLSAAESISLLQALAVVSDPRKRRGRRHSLQSILFLALGAIMAGARSYAAIADWAVAGEHEVRVCAVPPHASTFRRALSRLDSAALQAALTGWVLARRTAAAQAHPAGGPIAERRVVVAADGKTLRGSRTLMARRSRCSASTTTPRSWCSPRFRWSTAMRSPVHHRPGHRG